MPTFHVTGQEPLIRSIIRATFPDYNGRKIKISTAETVNASSYWDGGSRDYFAFVQLRDNTVVPGFQMPAQSAYDKQIDGATRIPLDSVPGLVCVRHSICQGKDAGITILVHPSTLNPAMLPPNEDFTENERKVLVATRSFKSSYGGDSRYRQTQSGLNDQEWMAAQFTLKQNGYLDARGALTTKGKNAAQNLR